MNTTMMLGQQDRLTDMVHYNAYKTSGGSSKSGLIPSSFINTFKDLEGKLNPGKQKQNTVARELQNKTQPIPR
jgi:hypothetical protein